MNSSMVNVSAAGIRLRFEATLPLRFSPTEYRGFAVGNAEDTDLHIRVVDATGSNHDESDRFDYFIGDCRNTEMPDHRWEVGSMSEGNDYILVDFYTETLPLNWLKLVYGKGEGTLYLSRRNAEEYAIDPYIFPLSNILISRLLKRHNSFLIHSSVVNDGGKGYLFTAVSGTGKSTMAGLWQKEGAVIVNDDMLAIRTDGEAITANNIPMPYYNDFQRSVELKGIFLISQSKTDFIKPISGAKATLKLFANTIYQPCNKASAVEHLKYVDKVAQHVPIYELGFKISNEIVEIIRKLNL